MKCFTLLSVVFIPIILSQDVVEFGDNNENPVEGGNVNPKIGEEDVNTRFFNVDLNSFAGQVAASALGTVVGNAGVNLAGNLLNNCNNRGKRSVLMHKLEKRQALEANGRTGNTDEDPEVATRFICPQDLLNPGGSNNNNNGRYCDWCSCRDRDCRYDCRKCGNSGLGGWSSSSSSSSNNNWGSSSSNSVNCNSCYCSSNSCRNTCRKCTSNNNNGHYNSNSGAHSHSSSSSSSSTSYVNCNSCYCSNSSCRNNCGKCRNNNSGWSSNNSGWNNNGGSYNNGWRSGSSVSGRTGENSEDTEVVASQNDSEQKSNNNEESVVFA